MSAGLPRGCPAIGMPRHRQLCRCFEGRGEAGQAYVLVDDHVGLGGTLANLRGHIEAQGGVVVAMTTLTESRDARRIALSSDTLDMLRCKHGQDLETFWSATYGYGLDCLTEVEAGYLARQLSVDAIRGCLAAAAEEASQGGLSTIPL